MFDRAPEARLLGVPTERVREQAVGTIVSLATIVAILYGVHALPARHPIRTTLDRWLCLALGQSRRC